MNQRGHSDWSGLLWLLAIGVVGCIMVEGTLIALTIYLWRFLLWRIVFGVLAIGGAILIVKYLKHW